MGLGRVRHTCYEEVDGIRLPVLALSRIVASKTAANREKDRAVLPSLLDALTALAESATKGSPPE